MSGEATARAVMERRRGRAIKAILGVKEATCDAHLPGHAADALRRVVLEELNDFCEVALAVLDGLEQRLADGVVWNELYLERLDQLHDAMVAAGVPDPGMRQPEEARHAS